MVNGSRVNEHRKRRVPATNWMVLIAILAAIFALGKVSTGQEYVPFVKDTGVMVERAELCFSPDLGAPSIKLLNIWQRLVNELEIYERGGVSMNREDALLGQHLADNAMCGTTAAYYHIVITQDTEGYVLARYDEQYGFGVGSFIVAKKDVLLDRSI